MRYGKIYRSKIQPSLCTDKRHSEFEWRSYAHCEAQQAPVERRTGRIQVELKATQQRRQDSTHLDDGHTVSKTLARTVDERHETITEGVRSSVVGLRVDKSLRPELIRVRIQLLSPAYVKLI